VPSSVVTAMPQCARDTEGSANSVSIC